MDRDEHSFTHVHTHTGVPGVYSSRAQLWYRGVSRWPVFLRLWQQFQLSSDQLSIKLCRSTASDIISKAAPTSSQARSLIKSYKGQRRIWHTSNLAEYNECMRVVMESAQKVIFLIVWNEFRVFIGDKLRMGHKKLLKQSK